MEEAFNAGHLDGSVLVIAAGAKEWQTLATVMSRLLTPTPLFPPVAPVEEALAALAAPVAAADPIAAPPAPIAPVVAPAAPVVAPPTETRPLPAQNESDGPWQVRLPDGQVLSGTREQLEEALRAGHLDASVLVLAAGASEWLPLGTIADRLSPAAPAVAPSDEPAANVPPRRAEASEGEAMPQASDEKTQPTVAEPRGAHASVGVDTARAASARTFFAPDAVALPEAPQSESPSTARNHGKVKWQVQLTDLQLEQAIRTGLLTEESMVRAVGTEVWVRLATARADITDVKERPSGDVTS